MEEKRKISRSSLREIATYQKTILVCILVYLLAMVARFALPAELRTVLMVGVAGIGIVSTVFVFLLATKVYSVAKGVVFGLLTLIPLVGLIMLLIINGKATATLRQHGIRVGLLGANLSEIG